LTPEIADRGDPVLETIAVYWEPIIKTYGFMEKTGLTLVRFSCPNDRMADWGLRIQDWARAGDEFVLVAGSNLNGETLQFNFLFEGPGVARYQAVLDRWTAEEPSLSLQVHRPVELIYFHGPHYGDRYGIAHAALNALAGRGVPVLTMACTGASVYLVLPEGMTGPAREGLGRAFQTPESQDKAPAA
jgi:hypothetical protein